MKDSQQTSRAARKQEHHLRSSSRVLHRSRHRALVHSHHSAELLRLQNGCEEWRRADRVSMQRRKRGKRRRRSSGGGVLIKACSSAAENLSMIVATTLISRRGEPGSLSIDFSTPEECCVSLINALEDSVKYHVLRKVLLINADEVLVPQVAVRPRYKFGSVLGR